MPVTTDITALSTTAANNSPADSEQRTTADDYLRQIHAFIATLHTDKAPLASPTFTGTVVLPSTTSVGNVSSTELGYLDGVTSAIQTQLNAKAPLASPTFTGTVTGPTFASSGGSADITSVGWKQGFQYPTQVVSLYDTGAAGAGRYFFIGATTDGFYVGRTQLIDGSTGAVYSVNIDQSGSVELTGPVTLSTGQLSFPATQNASSDANTLDDYEEGTWTPTIQADSGTIADYTATGKYTKIGNLVVASVRATITTKGTASGNLSASVPFTASGYHGFGGCEISSPSGFGITGWISDSSGTAYVFAADGTSPFKNDGDDFVFTVSYTV